MINQFHTLQRQGEQKVRERGGGGSAGTKLTVVFVGQKFPSHLGIDNLLLGAFKESKMGTLFLWWSKLYLNYA